MFKNQLNFIVNFFKNNSIRLKSTNKKLNKILFEMPRDRTHIVEAQKQRIKLKEKNSRYIPGTVNLQVLGNGASGAPASVYLFTDQSRYMFNCGEGTQRLAHEHKTKLSRLEHIFMTRTCWDHLGGLPGLSLTIQDAGVPDLTLHGPHGLDEIFQGMRRFVVLKNLKVKTINCEAGCEFEDQIMNVSCIPIRKKMEVKKKNLQDEPTKPLPEDQLVDDTDYYAYEKTNSRKSSPKIETDIKTSNSAIDLSKREETVVISYICKLKPKPGSLNLEKCVEKGVSPGPMLGQLKNGFDVILPDGTEVKANEVTAPTDAGPVFIFVDIPDESYLDNFAESAKFFQEFQKLSTNENDMALIVVHFTPQNIIQNKIYKKFMEDFPLSTRHFILNDTNKFSGYVAAHRIQWQLNQLNDSIFPVLKENHDLLQTTQTLYKRMKLSGNDNIKIFETTMRENQKAYKSENSNFFNDFTNALTSYHLRPRKGLDRSCEAILNPLEYIHETHLVEGFTETLKDFKIQFENRISVKKNKYKTYPKILFLGTGSCIPNKTRNVSSILVETSESACLLLDCGEGTWGQLVRFYGVGEAEMLLKKLKAIYISHLHADHHIGLIGLLKRRQTIFGSSLEPVLLLAPSQIQSWLHFYDKRIESINTQYQLIPNAEMIFAPLSNEKTFKMNIESVSTCLVRHCPHSFGVALQLKPSHDDDLKSIKITYSGDTMPCDDLVVLGMNSTILIHEATMEDELSQEAKFKMHSTVSEAVDQGRKMNAKFTILTHFSQRYAKLPRIEHFTENNVAIAFDNMQVNLNDLENFYLLYPSLKLMFSEHCEELEQKAQKRALRKERKRLASLGEEDKFNTVGLVR